jgi:hypothetical protein
MSIQQTACCNKLLCYNLTTAMKPTQQDDGDDSFHRTSIVIIKILGVAILLASIALYITLSKVGK